MESIVSQRIKLAGLLICFELAISSFSIKGRGPGAERREVLGPEFLNLLLNQLNLIAGVSQTRCPAACVKAGGVARAREIAYMLYCVARAYGKLIEQIGL